MEHSKNEEREVFGNTEGAEDSVQNLVKLGCNNARNGERRRLETLAVQSGARRVMKMKGI